jgi:hypothetical protein
MILKDLTFKNATTNVIRCRNFQRCKDIELFARGLTNSRKFFVMGQPYHLSRTEEIGQTLDSFICRREIGRSDVALAVA